MPDTSNTSATQATQVRHEYNTSATRVQHEWEASRMNATQELHKRHECDTSATQTARVKSFDFDKDTSENIFSQMKSYKDRTNFILRNTF